MGRWRRLRRGSLCAAFEASVSGSVKQVIFGVVVGGIQTPGPESCDAKADSQDDDNEVGPVHLVASEMVIVHSLLNRKFLSSSIGR
jgi:hypothetical protein